MRIINPNNETQPFYLGICKTNNFPKHVKLGQKRVIRLDEKTKVTMYNSERSREYIYIEVPSDNGPQMMWVKDKSIFELPALTTTKIERKKKEVIEEVTK